MPPNSVAAELVSKKSGNIPQSVGFIPMNGVVVACEGLLKLIGPEAVDLSKPLANEAVELLIRLILGATFDDHRRKFVFQTWRQLNFHQLVTAFLGVDAGHDRQVYGPPQIHQVGITLVLNFHSLLRLLFLVILAIIALVLVILIVASLSKNLRPKNLVLFLVPFPIRIELEDVQTILNINVVIQSDCMGDLVFFLYEI